MAEITWKSFIESPDRGYWDQTLLSDWLTVDYADILVTPGHWREKIPTDPAHLVFISSDEEGECPFWLLDNPVWKMTPNLHLAHRPDRAIPLGYTPHTRPALRSLDLPTTKEGWTFSGQVTHSRRQSAMEALRKLGEPFETETFASGLDPEAYIKTLWKAQWAPCPAGNVRPETFRMWEALEAGAVPILDATSPAGDRDYWPFVLGDHPFPVLWDWSAVGDYVTEQAPMTEAAVWYSQYRYRFLRNIWEAWAHLHEEPWVAPVDRVTTIITASPIPSHPDFGILAETVESVRARLPGRIIIAFDGARRDSPSYTEHIRRVAYHANHNWPEVFVWHDGVWRHQAGTIKAVLPLVYPDYSTVLMMEHDTPLTGDIDFHRLVELLYIGNFNSIRFAHEAQIPTEHDYLMRGWYEDKHVRIKETVQYSQRPHIALKSFYTGLVGQLPDSARTYVEDWAYGFVANSPWDHHKLGIYAPKDDMKRSYHLDGRAGADKEDFWW